MAAGHLIILAPVRDNQHCQYEHILPAGSSVLRSGRYLHPDQWGLKRKYWGTQEHFDPFFFKAKQSLTLPMEIQLFFYSTFDFNSFSFTPPKTIMVFLVTNPCSLQLPPLAKNNGWPFRARPHDATLCELFQTNEVTVWNYCVQCCRSKQISTARNVARNNCKAGRHTLALATLHEMLHRVAKPSATAR